MDRSFQLQEQKKSSLSRPSGLRSTTLLQNESGNSLHSTIISMQQGYGNQYVQQVLSGERMPCPELCGLSKPLVVEPTRPAAQFKPHSCDSCVFHPQRSVTGTSLPTGSIPIQAKLAIGQPADVYEQEANRIADMILQCQCTTPECEEEGVIRRQIDEEEEKPIQMKQMSPDLHVENSQDISEQILHQKCIGRALEPETRKFMESRFGYDFGEVRIHTDNQAEVMARNLNAEAFTIGRDVYFGSGRYNPATNSGQRLVAHELTHVVQQSHQPRLQRLVRTSLVTCPAGQNPYSADRRASTLLDNAMTLIDSAIAQRSASPAHADVIAVSNAMHTAFRLNPANNDHWTLAAPHFGLHLIRRRLEMAKDYIDSVVFTINCTGIGCSTCAAQGAATEAFVCPGNATNIALCPAFWANNSNQRGRTFAHEVFHINFNFIEDWAQPDRANAHCYAQFVALLNGFNSPAGFRCH